MCKKNFEIKRSRDELQTHNKEEQEFLFFRRKKEKGINRKFTRNRDRYVLDNTRKIMEMIGDKGKQDKCEVTRR